MTAGDVGAALRETVPTLGAIRCELEELACHGGGTPRELHAIKDALGRIAYRLEGFVLAPSSPPASTEWGGAELLDLASRLRSRADIEERVLARGSRPRRPGDPDGLLRRASSALAWAAEREVRP